MKINTVKHLAFLLLTFIFCFSTSCLNKKHTIEIGSIDKVKKETIKYLALGDSYTIGEGVEAAKRWPIQLGEQLKVNHFDVESVKIIAQTGWTTRDLLNSIEKSTLKEYNLVSLLIGVNNQYQNLPFTKFKSEFDLLLEKSIEIAGNKEKVFVVSIPDYGVTPFGKANSEKIANELNMYNNYMETQCKKQSIPFVNITEISRKLGDSPGALTSDNLHPSGTQYTSWMNQILPMLVKKLKK